MNFKEREFAEFNIKEKYRRTNKELQNWLSILKQLKKGSLNVYLVERLLEESACEHLKHRVIMGLPEVEYGNDIKKLEDEINKVKWDIRKFLNNPQQKEPQQNPNLKPQLKLKELLPDTLQDVEAIGIFRKAIDIKLITLNQGGLKWNDTKQLCAYFAEKLSNKFHLSKMTDKDGNQTTAWKPFEDLFKQKGLKEAKQNWMRLNTKFEPTDYKKIDTLFTEQK